MGKTDRTIYAFLKGKLRDRGIRVDDFRMMCGFSKATLYRIMTGSQVPTEVQQDQIIDLLRFDEFETDRFLECVKALDYDDNQLKAFKVIESIFTGHEGQPHPESREFIVSSDSGKTIRTYEEILDVIRSASVKDGFFCEMRIYSCVHGEALEPVIDLLGELRGKRVSVRHYIKFYEYDNHENMLAFRATLRLLNHSVYQLYSRHFQQSRDCEWMDDIMLIRIPGQYVVLSFNAEGYHECTLSEGQTCYSLFMDRWNRITPLYETLVRERNINLLLEMSSEMEESGESVVFKVNPCYNLINRPMWDAVKARFTDENYQAFYRAIGDVNCTREKADAMLNAFAEILEKRYQLTYKNANYSIFTVHGLTSLAETGRLSDHYSFLPSFTKEEVRAILENLMERNEDPDDKFSYMILDKETDENICIVANSGGGFVVEYSTDFEGNGDIFNYVFTQRYLAKTFMTFVKKYLRENLTLGREDAAAFMERLLTQV